MGLMPVGAVASGWLLAGEAPTPGLDLGCPAVGAGSRLAGAPGGKRPQ